MRVYPLFLHRAALLALAGSIAACSSSDPATPGDDAASRAARAGIPARSADIVGTITNVARGTGAVIGRVRIEEKPGQPSGDVKAVVDVTDRTRLFRRDGSALRPVTFADLRVDAVVEAWFTGPVRESYPVQATGAAIIVR